MLLLHLSKVVLLVEAAQDLILLCLLQLIIELFHLCLIVLYFMPLLRLHCTQFVLQNCYLLLVLRSSELYVIGRLLGLLHPHFLHPLALLYVLHIDLLQFGLQKVVLLLQHCHVSVKLGSALVVLFLYDAQPLLHILMLVLVFFLQAVPLLG